MAKHSARGTAWAAQRRRVLDRDGWVCSGCGCDLVASQTASNGATVDHVEPISLDPERSYADADLIAMCRSCNATKGAKQLVRLEWVNKKWLPNGV